MPARLLITLLVAALAAQAQSKPKSHAKPAVFSQITEMTATLSEITGWLPREKIRSELLSRAQFRRFVESQTQGRGKAKEIRAEEIALKMFGFVPQDYDLARQVVDLLDEQAAAFYDYKRKRLFVLDSTKEGDDQRAALVHELAHALADQRHPLGKFLDGAGDDNDAAIAREAVMEGQATWLTWAYETKRMGGEASVPARMIDRLTAETSANPDFPVLSASPLYVRESLLFPYNAGARFQDAVYRRLGRGAFEAVFSDGPQSTQQILHPGAYLERTVPTHPEPPALPEIAYRPGKARDFQVLIEGNVGEFDHAVLLRQQQEDGAFARHWRGGAFKVYEHKQSKRHILTYTSEWDSAESARDYFGAYERILRGKWKTMQVDSRTDNEIRGSGDAGNFVLRVAGPIVQSLEGLP